MLKSSLPRRGGLLALILLLAAATAIQAAVRNFETAPSGNHVTFYAHSTGHDFEGKSPQVAGKFGCDRERIAETAYGEFRIPVRSLKTGIDGRDNEMYATFEEPRYPEIAFKLRSMREIRQNGADTYSARAVGDLSIHGVTREVSLPVTAVFRGEQVTVTGTASVKITDFGMKPPGFLFFRVADQVRLSFRVSGNARSAS